MTSLTNKFVLLMMALLVVSGCATIKHEKPFCIVAGAVVGGVAAGQDEDDNDAAGAVVGGLIGWLVCAQDNDNDGDGVKDKADNCPATGKGIAVDASGCALDGDNDGVADHLDSCRGTVADAPVDSKGCALDSDGDGVADYMDKCPVTPKGDKVDKQGCTLDSDKDGVADSKDRCPKTKMGHAVDNKGCHAMVSLTGLNFATASADLTVGAKRKLSQVVSTLEKNPSIHVRIEGHTDSQGNEANNQSLSEDRAESVMQYLIEQGISAKRLDARGYGESSPIGSNDTEDGMSQNRRVDFVVTKN